MFLVLGAGAFYDIREHRIPNWWILSAMITGILLAVLKSDQSAGLSVLLKESGVFLLRMAVVTAVFFLFFLCRMIGAGDIKLAALICGYLGLKEGAAVVGCGFAIGAIWSFLRMIKKGSIIYRFSHFTAYIRRLYRTREITAYYVPDRDGRSTVIPLGVCMFLGAVIFIIYKNWI